jgi:hypothetical protein
MNPWSDPSSYLPEPKEPNWWERNRVAATIIAAAFVILVLAFTHSAAKPVAIDNDDLALASDGPEQ